jgi:hypothetical protein
VLTGEPAGRAQRRAGELDDVTEPMPDRGTKSEQDQLLNTLGRIFLMMIYGGFVAGAIRGFDEANWHHWDTWAGLLFAVCGLVMVGALVDDRIRSGHW